MDFSVSEGDKIDLSDVLVGYNPLQHDIDNFIMLTTVGSTTNLVVDRDGTGTAL
jgi:large repetitive protein